jgi:putative nucleotidyltransferase with HDIG domain
MAMHEHIMAHSLQVCRVALCLADHLAANAIALNRDLIQAAALLHDITKSRSFTTGENHAQSGDQLLGELGYPEVGYIVGRHVALDTYSVAAPIAEVEVVNYADKRVLHDRIVTLPERMAYILERYGRREEYRQRLNWLWEMTVQLEERLFRQIPFGPEELRQRIDAEGPGAEQLVPPEPLGNSRHGT